MAKRFRPAHVLVVDDDAAIRDVMYELLEDEGFHVTEVEERAC